MLRLFGNETDVAQISGGVVTLGVFDGVHLGHQDVIRTTIATASERNVPSVAITFDVHPRTQIPGNSATGLITSLEHRLQLLDSLGLEAAWVLAFTEDLRMLSAEQFLRRYLIGHLHASALVLGHDTQFGADRMGNASLLAGLQSTYGYELIQVPPVLRADDMVISSTAIRDAIRTGDLKAATQMLGRTPSVLGTVVSGLGIGRTLGFPTLNLSAHHEIHPPQGVYFSHARCGDTQWPTITNIGTRPTIDVDGEKDILIEAHVLTPVGNLYGQTIELEFLKFVRHEQKFESRDALIAQIDRDVQAARHYFGL